MTDVSPDELAARVVSLLSDAQLEALLDAVVDRNPEAPAWRAAVLSLPSDVADAVAEAAGREHARRHVDLVAADRLAAMSGRMTGGRSGAFTAKFPGHCPGCRMPIDAGEWIHSVDGRYHHEGC